MQISTELTGLNKALLTLDANKVRKAARMALNDTAKRVRTAADKQLRNKFAVKAAFTKRKLKIKTFASNGKLQVTISAGSRSLGMQHFAAKQNKKGVSVKIIKGRKAVLIPGGFLTRYKSGQIGVWQRIGKGSSAAFGGLVERRVITVASMFNQTEVAKVTQRTIDTKWPERFAHHLKRQFK